MTQMIRHHTTQADARARRCAPQAKLATFDKAPEKEMVLGLQMALMARREGHRKGRLSPNHCAPRMDDICRAIEAVMSGEMLVVDIARSVSEYLGKRVSGQMVSDRLRGVMLNRMKYRDVSVRQRLWMLV